jgi:hypothetical protein
MARSWLKPNSGPDKECLLPAADDLSESFIPCDVCCPEASATLSIDIVPPVKFSGFGLSMYKRCQKTVHAIGDLLIENSFS